MAYNAHNRVAGYYYAGEILHPQCLSQVIADEGIVGDYDEPDPQVTYVTDWFHPASVTCDYCGRRLLPQHES